MRRGAPWAIPALPPCMCAAVGSTRAQQPFRERRAACKCHFPTREATHRIGDAKVVILIFEALSHAREPVLQLHHG
jgi:hypothetical protein